MLSQQPRWVLKEKTLRYLSLAPWEIKRAKFSFGFQEEEDSRGKMGGGGRERKGYPSSSSPDILGRGLGIWFSVACKKALEPVRG